LDFALSLMVLSTSIGTVASGADNSGGSSTIFGRRAWDVSKDKVTGVIVSLTNDEYLEAVMGHQEY
jgi:hypothetical protein